MPAWAIVWISLLTLYVICLHARLHVLTRSYLQVCASLARWPGWLDGWAATLRPSPGGLIADPDEAVRISPLLRTRR